MTGRAAEGMLHAPSERLLGMEIAERHYDPFTVMEQFGRPIGTGVYFQPFTDERDAQMVTVDERRGIVRLGPFSLEPGAHRLEFQAADAPAVAADLISNGDRRPLSFAFGMWRWMVQDQDR